MAAEVVRRVAEEDAYSNRLLPALLKRSGLSSRDRGLAVELAMGTLRRLPAIDHALSSAVARPLGEASPEARAALRVGAYQLLFTRIPDHAAVAESVALVNRPGRGFVNAVLRRLARHPPRWPDGPDDAAVAIRSGLAPWAVAELRTLLGEGGSGGVARQERDRADQDSERTPRWEGGSGGVARQERDRPGRDSERTPQWEVEEAAVALAGPAPLTIRTNPCRVTTEDLEAALRAGGHEPEAGRLHPGCLRLARGSPAALPGFAEGWFAVQDEASAWVVDVLDPRPGDLVLDACAGPGGKAGDIACRAGAVVAGDLSEGRARLVGQAAARLGVTARVLVSDAARPAVGEGFDRVLVDAPCSGIGSARRRPELLWRPLRSRLSGLARLQVRLAAGAASVLRPGGVLVYSVCTFPRAETDAVCDALLGKAPHLSPDPFPGPDGELVERARLWPHRHGTDGMFVARFIRAR
ncbi:MAG: transcription antitermination factor NusB [Actinomycetota bacterium]